MIKTLSDLEDSIQDEQLKSIIRSIATAIEKISYSLSSEITDLQGYTGSVNTFAEQTSTADEFAEKQFFSSLTNKCKNYSSEEQPRQITFDNKLRYNVFIDPLDGSSNIETAGPVGSIFTVIDSVTGSIVLAGYALYSFTTIVVIATSNSVKMYVLNDSSDNVLKCFELINDNVTCPFRGTRYVINESYSKQWNDSHTSRFVEYAKQNRYSTRNMGCMVADCHAILMNGGIFVYPATLKNPQGKLRTDFEITPFSFIFMIADGLAYTTQKYPVIDWGMNQWKSWKGPACNTSKKTSTVVVGSVTNVIEYFSER